MKETDKMSRSAENISFKGGLGALETTNGCLPVDYWEPF